MQYVKFKLVDEQLEYLRKGAAEIIREEEMRAKLEHSLKTGKPLRVKLGVDPTAPDLHLGHTVVLRKLKHFQDLGHTAIFLVGDFTAMVGDPTGQSETRPSLSREQVDANAKTYLDQVYKILDREKTEVRYNSEWLGKLTGHDMIRLCAYYPLARMLEREDFKERLAAGWKDQIFGPAGGALVRRPSSVGIHELLYPLLQAYDSVELRTDVELGATEQKFNLLVGRDIQRAYGQDPQVAFTMPILVGLDGARKMSKSLGNYVGITESPNDMFGKVMSIPDWLMDKYFELLTDTSYELTRQSVESRQREPRSFLRRVLGGVEIKMEVTVELARLIVAGFHGEAAAQKARDEFQRVFRERQAPEGMPKYEPKAEPDYVVSPSGKMKLTRIMMRGLSLRSRAEAERLIRQNAVEKDGTIITNPAYEVDLNNPQEFVLRVGKTKFLRVVIK